MRNYQSRSPIEPSELELMPELASRNYSYCPNHIEKCSQFSALNMCWAGGGLQCCGSQISVQTNQARLLVDSRARNSVCCSN
eukprot:3149611-Pyramimonas_sp.AAC.1